MSAPSRRRKAAGGDGRGAATGSASTQSGTQAGRLAGTHAGTPGGTPGGTRTAPAGGTPGRGEGTTTGARRGRRPTPTLDTEASLALPGCLVAGVDEVGRGAWAGPVSVGVAVVAPGAAILPGLADSKLLDEPVREAMFEPVGRWCATWAVGHASPSECDELGMTRALALACARALGGLAGDRWPSVLILDGNLDYASRALDLVAVESGGQGPAAGDRQRPAVHTVVRADGTCASVAAASVLAKVTRDRIMRRAAPHFPPFDFDRNKGYPSPAHRRALDGYGTTALHRRSWSYVAALPWPGSGAPGWRAVD